MPNDAAPTILAELDGRGVARVILNRPDVHNAMNEDLIGDLTQVLMEFDADPAVRAVILTGAGKSFCAGGDLGWMRRTADYSFDENLDDAMTLGDLLRVLNEMRKPTIGLINGAAYGGGVGLTACCDIVIAADSAKFCLSEVKLGLIPATISPYVVRKMGENNARRYFLTAEVFDAEVAAILGMVHEVVHPKDLEDAGERFVDMILQGAPGAIASAKELIQVVSCATIDGTLIDWTARRIAEARATDEGKEGAQAFLEKRAPKWRLGPGSA
jgi:methylglutaconyl-CoA hydratase